MSTEQNNASSIISKGMQTSATGCWGDDGVGYGDYPEQLPALFKIRQMSSASHLQPWSENSKEVQIGKAWQIRRVRGAVWPLCADPAWAVQCQRIPQTDLYPVRIKSMIPSKLARYYAMIDNENWSTMGADLKRKIYEGLLEKNVEDTKEWRTMASPPGALIQAMVACVRPEPLKPQDPACSTGGGFFCPMIYRRFQNYPG